MGDETAKTGEGSLNSGGWEKLSTAPTDAGTENADTSKAEAKAEVVGDTQKGLADLLSDVEANKKVQEVVDTVTKAAPALAVEPLLSQTRRTLAQMVNYSRGIGAEYTAENVKKPQFNIAWLETITPILTKDPTEAGLKQAKEAFGTWLEKNVKGTNHIGMYELWKTSEARAQDLPNEAAFRSRADELLKIFGVNELFSALKSKAADLKKRIDSATKPEEISTIEEEMKPLEECKAKAVEMSNRISAIEKIMVGEDFTYGKPAIEKPLGDLKARLKTTDTLDALSGEEVTVKKLGEEVEKWTKVNTLARDPDLSSEKRDEIMGTAEAQKADLKPEDAEKQLEAAIEEVKKTLEDIGDEPGLADEMRKFFDGKVGKMLNLGEGTKKMLAESIIKIAALASTLPFIGPMIRNMMGSRQTLMEMAYRTENKEFGDTIHREIEAMKVMKRYGLSNGLANAYIVLQPKEFLALHPEKEMDSIKDAAERATMVSNVQQLQKDLVLFGKSPSWSQVSGIKDLTMVQVVSSQAWHEVIVPKPKAVVEKAPEKAEPKVETPEIKTGKLYDDMGLKPDQKVAVGTLKVKDVVDGSAKYGTMDEPLQKKLQATVKKYLTEEQKKNADLTVSDFFNEYFKKESKPIEIQTS